MHVLLINRSMKYFTRFNIIFRGRNLYLIQIWTREICSSTVTSMCHIYISMNDCLHFVGIKMHESVIIPNARPNDWATRHRHDSPSSNLIIKRSYFFEIKKRSPSQFDDGSSLGEFTSLIFGHDLQCTLCPIYGHHGSIQRVKMTRIIWEFREDASALVETNDTYTEDDCMYFATCDARSSSSRCTRRHSWSRSRF